MPQYCKNCYKELVDPQVKFEDLTYCSDERKCDNCGEIKHLVVEKEKPVEKDDNVMTIAECNIETQKHIENVRKFIRFMTDKLTQRGVDHDSSKMETPEVELFAQHTKQLSSLTYDSEEYKAALEALKPALEHHYATNRHHPEHFSGGINDMTLIDIVEMLCDWKASTLRTSNGNLLKSIEKNADRFEIDGQLKQILLNTARMIDEQEIK